MDYLVYAYLQKGDNKLAEEQVKYLNTIKAVYPADFKVAYAFAAIPSRYLLENKKWTEAAALQIPPANISWNEFPWQEAIIHFTRLLGEVHIGKMVDAKSELIQLNRLRDTLAKQKDSYKSEEVEIQIKTGEAWIQFESANKTNAVNIMKLAADMEDSTEKHPVTPGEVLPARELLGDMLLQINQNEEALKVYEAVLKKIPNRFNSLYNAGVAAEKCGNKQKTVFYFKRLLTIVDTANSDRPEVIAIRSFLKMH
jgi:tetratricopeptide (TPR) repeat protein